jgi:hypothetical protein
MHNLLTAHSKGNNGDNQGFHMGLYLFIALLQNSSHDFIFLRKLFPNHSSYQQQPTHALGLLRER